MAEPEHPHDDQEYEDERFEDEGRRSIFSALWFRAILVVIVLGVVAAVAVPYVLELANQPAPKTAVVGKPETTPAPAPVAPPPPIASVPSPSSPALEKSPVPERPPTMDKSSSSESSATPMAPSTDRPAAGARSGDASRSSESRSAVAGNSSVAREQTTASRAPGPSGPRGGYFVQVGAFKNPDTAKKLATRLRGQNYSVEETSAVANSAQPARPASGAPAPSTSGSASDRYDVYVTGSAPAEINAKLGAKGLSAEPSASGVVVKPSLPLRDAVALSKDLAVDGLKVQVRRSASGMAPAPTAPSTPSSATGDGTLYRVRVGPFEDKMAATSTLRELEQKGYSPFIARGGQ